MTLRSFFFSSDRLTLMRSVAGYLPSGSTLTRDEKALRTSASEGSGLTPGNHSALFLTAVSITLSSTARTNASCASDSSSFIDALEPNLEPSSIPKGTRMASPTPASW